MGFFVCLSVSWFKKAAKTYGKLVLGAAGGGNPGGVFGAALGDQGIRDWTLGHLGLNLGGDRGSPYDALIEDARAREEAQAAQAAASRNQYQSALMGFDPQAYMEQSAGSMFNTLGEQFARQQASQAANLNARGLFGSNLGGGRMQQDFNDRLANALAGLSMQGGQMEMQRMGMMGGLAGMDMGQANRYWDAATGLTVTAKQQKMMNAASKRSMWGNIVQGGLTAGGAVLGTILAPGAGTAAGAAAGSALGSAFRSPPPAAPQPWMPPQYQYPGFGLQDPSNRGY